MVIAHIINPVKVNESSDLFIAQPVTFESMRSAKAFAEASDPTIEIRLLACTYEEDSDYVPSYFEQTPFLIKSILDYGTFEKSRKLPLIKDILDLLYQQTKGVDYLIYSNVDIAVMPSFYRYIKSKLISGIDALIINRRTITSQYKRVEEIPLMYSEIGVKHPGYDCFVFRREIYTSFNLGVICIGANWIGTLLFMNLLVISNKLFVEKDAHLTFHIGKDGAWLSGMYYDYDIKNKKEAYIILDLFLKQSNTRVKIDELNRIKRLMDNFEKKSQLSFFKYLLIKIKSFLK